MLFTGIFNNPSLHRFASTGNRVGKYNRATVVIMETSSGRRSFAAVPLSATALL
jgi:hypothetical protein